MLGRKAMTNLDSILKSRDVTLTTKVHVVKAVVCPVVMYGCESWTIKKADHQRIDAFELWCWRRLLRFLWTARKSGQLILREIDSECHPTISSSVIPFSCLQSFPASGSSQMNQFFPPGGQSTGISASTSVLPVNIQD